jgi:hypothetical protein
VAYGSWLEKARDLVRNKIAVRDETLMVYARHRVAVDAMRDQTRELWPGLSAAMKAMDEIERNLNAEQAERAMQLFHRRISFRDALCEATGGRWVFHDGRLETWAEWGVRITGRRSIERTAHMLAALRVLSMAPEKPVQAQRQQLSNAVLAEKARRAEEVAADMVGGAA